MRLSPVRFNRFLNRIGETVAWRRAYACPCVNPASGAADPTCPNCKGKGRYWSDAVQGVAGVAGEKVQQRWAQMGPWEPGDVIFSIPSDSPVYEIGAFDRAVLLNSSLPFSVVMTHSDRVHFPIITIDRIFWLDEHKKPVEGAIPTIQDDGTLLWPDTAPPHNKSFSITGRRRPEYFCFGEYPQDRSMHHGAALPRRVVLRKFDLYGR